jgi:hypothetical protein
VREIYSALQTKMGLKNYKKKRKKKKKNEKKTREIKKMRKQKKKWGNENIGGNKKK